MNAYQEISISCASPEGEKIRAQCRAREAKMKNFAESRLAALRRNATCFYNAYRELRADGRGRYDRKEALPEEKVAEMRREKW